MRLGKAARADNEFGYATGRKDGVQPMMKEVWQSEDALTTVEYAMMLMLIVVASAAAWATVGTGTSHSAALSSSQLPN